MHTLYQPVNKLPKLMHYLLKLIHDLRKLVHDLRKLVHEPFKPVDVLARPFHPSGATVDTMAVEFRAVFPAVHRAAIEALVASQETLEDVVREGLARSPPVLVAAVVAQDEYTLDVVLPWSAGVFLVYDVT